MAVPSVTVTVNRLRHTLAEALGWGRPSDVSGALALAGVLHPPVGRAPEVAASPATTVVSAVSATSAASVHRGRARHATTHTVRG